MAHFLSLLSCNNCKIIGDETYLNWCDLVFVLLKLRVIDKILGLFDKFSSHAQNTLPAIAGNLTQSVRYEMKETTCLQQPMC
ncbi:Uncharacterised protein [Vibrio cholerae]|nr:Uncharacterised protein [Vibrio cholerae]CSC91430.1 Uncharacterised protein [Vibrio cholerae]